MSNNPIIKVRLINWIPEAFMDIISNEGNLENMIIDNEKLIIIVNGEKYSIKIKKE